MAVDDFFETALYTSKLLLKKNHLNSFLEIVIELHKGIYVDVTTHILKKKLLRL